MSRLKKMKQKGFTLIELLVVISVVGMLASIVLTSLNSARSKSRNARKISDLRQLSTAVQVFYGNNNRMPANFAPGSGACEFIQNTNQYISSMQELVTDGELKGTPHSPGPQGYGPGYCYYDYGRGNAIGALFVTALENVPGTTTGIPPSCRPFAASTNWCDQSSNTYYCICNPY